MNLPRSEDLLVGLITLALIPLIVLRIRRGIRDGRLPLYRSFVSREDGPGRFRALLVLHGLSLLVVAAISADLLFDLHLRSVIS